ncbi:mitochondrial ribosomal protein S30 [Xylocopa sonorina]|uniref:mitochondrial ribosomal protein S30 n=1 Tax=Xylocopa sonorina TaxID=1818115 RepID=UPI00403AC110
MYPSYFNMYTGLHKCSPNCSLSILRTVARKFSSTVLTETEDTIYPPILDLSRKACIKRKNKVWYDKIEKLESVEEKLFGINMPRYYGWKGLLLEEGVVKPNSLDHAQYITHTHVINDHKLPEFYNSVITPEQSNAIVQNVKHHIENFIIFEYCHRLREQEIVEKVDKVKQKQLQNANTNTLVYQMNRLILAAMSSSMPHLLETQIDFDPRREAFWFVGGVQPSASIKKMRESSRNMKDYVNEPITMPVHYLGSPILQLRHQFPLREIISLTESANPELNIPEFKFDPRVLGYFRSFRHATCIPGFWPGDIAEFGLLSYHNLNSLYLTGFPLLEEAITVQAIFASYGWLLPQACYQGFSTVNEITYPLVSQTVLTNGQFWSFCVYQLNTTLVHSDHADENPKRNLCWITEPIKLFDKIEDGKIEGFNEEVLQKLITFYANVPAERSNENMKPYLGKTVKHVADIEDPERREWLEQKFKHLMANRPRHLMMPEIYNWQRIYMIDHKTRPMDKKRDPWEFGFNPHKRRLDHHTPVYIPRRLRANPKKRKVGRWAKAYYPDA